MYRNDDVMAFLDRYPSVPGHTIVILNIHVERLDGLKNEAVAHALMQALIEVPRILMEAGLCTDFTILSDNGMHAEQDIPHVHFHVIPRHKKEELHLHIPTDAHAAKEEQLRNV